MEIEKVVIPVAGLGYQSVAGDQISAQRDVARGTKARGSVRG